MLRLVGYVIAVGYGAYDEVWYCSWGLVPLKGYGTYDEVWYCSWGLVPLKGMLRLVGYFIAGGVWHH
ncbi:hypothetical protein J6590_076335 [Homalodisca vitripennis]|nr:hypothetical protein J6590_076335 [Homalodisca vitripennis]